jgi:NAD(P)-dependent dehydrogenase (short-subunit alcohol dehydrogenase family)
VNAGITKLAPLADSSEGLFEEITGVNFTGAYFTVQRAGQGLKAKLEVATLPLRAARTRQRGV